MATYYLLPILITKTTGNPVQVNTHNDMPQNIRKVEAKSPKDAMLLAKRYEWELNDSYDIPSEALEKTGKAFCVDFAPISRVQRTSGFKNWKCNNEED